jgi:hypothetical protein
MQRATKANAEKNTAQNIKHIKNLNLVLLNKVYFNI